MARKKVRSSTATGAAPPPAANGEAPAASRRWIRSGGRVIRMDTTTDHPTVSDSAGGQGSHGGGGGGGGTEDPVPAGATPMKSKRIAAASSSSGPVAKKGKKTTPGTPEDEEGRRRRDGGTAASATVSSTSLASRPLPPRYPDYPSLQPGQHVLSKKHENAVFKWMRKCNKISELSQQALRKDIPTLKDNPKDPLTADAVVSSQDKAMVWRVACSVVGVTSKKHDGELVSQCTGIVVGLDGVNKCAKILTAASLVCDHNGEFHDPTLMLSVHLPNKIVTEGRLLHFNVHYGVALVEIMGDFQLQVPSFGSRTDYGDDVFVLARDENMSLMVRHGMISWDQPMLCGNHCMLLSCDIPQGASGGPVIDHDGNFIAIAVDDSSVTPVSMIRTCLDMWLQFSRVARPILGMRLEAVELLDVSRQEELRRDYNIADGFIVKKVGIDSTAETLGIRKGDVIVFQDSDSSTLPQLEDYLLSLGWGYLQGISLTTDLRVQVHNLMDSYSESITFPLQFSDDSKRVHW